MTKEMREKCLNKDMVIFGKLPKDVQDEMIKLGRGQLLCSYGKWANTFSPSWCFNAVYRIDPSTPYDPEFEDNEVVITPNGFYGVSSYNGHYSCSSALCRPNCLGIIYEKDGVEALRTSVDLKFGTPKRVRFAK